DPPPVAVSRPAFRFRSVPLFSTKITSFACGPLPGGYLHVLPYAQKYGGVQRRLQRMEVFNEILLSIIHLMKLTSESESCWRKRLGRGELPFVKLGANVRVKGSDFEKWLQERTVPARVRNR